MISITLIFMGLLVIVATLMALESTMQNPYESEL